jgi:hypothetical protein
VIYPGLIAVLGVAIGNPLYTRFAVCDKAATTPTGLTTLPDTSNIEVVPSLPLLATACIEFVTLVDAQGAGVANKTGVTGSFAEFPLAFVATNLAVYVVPEYEKDPEFAGIARFVADKTAMALLVL